MVINLLMKQSKRCKNYNFTKFVSGYKKNILFLTHKIQDLLFSQIAKNLQKSTK